MAVLNQVANWNVVVEWIEVVIYRKIEIQNQKNNNNSNYRTQTQKNKCNKEIKLCNNCTYRMRFIEVKVIWIDAFN